MTLTDAMVGAAMLWLLFVLCGMPGLRAGAPAATGETTAAAIAVDAAIDIVPFSVWHRDVPQSPHVTPPLPDEEVSEALAGSSSGNVYNALGATAVHGGGLPQTLSLTEITIQPESNLTLANLDASGLIVLQAGWLELAELDGDARLTRSPLAESPAPRADEAPPTITAGDRLSFGPGATIMLRNRGEHPARLLTASVLALSGLGAAAAARTGRLVEPGAR